MTSSDPIEASLSKARMTLQAMGLRPMTWDEVMQTAQARLSVDDLNLLRKYHRSFTGYSTESTLQKFYGFCYSRQLQDVLAGYRFERLATLISSLDHAVEPGLRLCEVGAGGGHVLHWLQEHKAPRLLAAFDLVPEAQTLWPTSVQTVSLHPSIPKEKFDIVLCIDSLGEVHDDPDQALTQPASLGSDALETLLEQRYGFAHKLEPWKNGLAPNGRVWVFEPIEQVEVWSALAVLLTQVGWRVHLRKLTSGQPFLECLLN